MRSRPPRRTRAVAHQEEGSNRRNIIIAAGVGLGVIVLGALLFLSLRGPSPISGIQQVVGLSRGHDPSVVYENAEELPPIGGIHDPVWQNCGIYDEPLETKHVIHSLEHGAVWVTYNPSLSEDDVAKLQSIVRNESYVVLSPYPNLKSPVVLTAWGIQLELDSVNDSRIPVFIERYQQGPQTPELGAACVNGTGSPIVSLGQ
ncbi:MAG: DUF3105 domain-containing protein [Candidatus Promineifilaceae bacterium]